MENRNTPAFITSLKDGEIFVFGSNKEGMHGGGAASVAHQKFGAKWGEDVGMTGNCYAIPTMDGSIDIIRKYVDDFTEYARSHPELTFLVTASAAASPAGLTRRWLRPSERPQNWITSRSRKDSGE